MTRRALVHGIVTYRLGDGPLLQVPTGEVEVESGLIDVTLSWGTEDTRQSAAVPASDFAKFVATRAITWVESPQSAA